MTDIWDESVFLVLKLLISSSTLLEAIYMWWLKEKDNYFPLSVFYFSVNLGIMLLSLLRHL